MSFVRHAFKMIDTESFSSLYTEYYAHHFGPIINIFLIITAMVTGILGQALTHNETSDFFTLFFIYNLLHISLSLQLTYCYALCDCWYGETITKFNIFELVLSFIAQCGIVALAVYLLLNIDLEGKYINIILALVLLYTLRPLISFNLKLIQLLIEGQSPMARLNKLKEAKRLCQITRARELIDDLARKEQEQKHMHLTELERYKRRVKVLEERVQQMKSYIDLVR